MSASLVGSEMCIRDSSSLTHMGLQCPKTGDCVAPFCPPSPRMKRGPPVSYTHLTLPTICSV
eukprot:15104308-Alexandrium_andersonii.AAC.1